MKFRKILTTHFLQEILRDYRVWISVFLAINLINLPNLVLCFVPYFNWTPTKLWPFSLALTLVACVFGLRVRLMLWLASPLLLLVPACLACLISIYNLPTTFLFLALFETNSVELSAMQSQIIYAGLGALLLVTFYVWFVKKRVPASFRLGPVARVLVLLTLLGPVLADLLAHGTVIGEAALKERLLSTFPSSTFYGAYEAFDMRARVESRKGVAENLPLTQAPEFRDDQQRQVHMLVIGESASKSCFSLYGYDRPTTPMLEHTPGLMPFRDVSSTATFTLLAVPALLTASPAGQVLEATRQASVLSAYKKAGFRVYWISAQRKHGTYDTVTSIFSGDADESDFAGGAFDIEGTGTYAGVTDVSLIPKVRSILKRGEEKVLFVLHTIGSHGPYFTRYQPQFARFPVDAQAASDALDRIGAGTSTDPHDLELVQNSYDNTICATDFLLANLINDLKNINASSWLCYVSDHGENTSKAVVGKFMHGLVSPQVVEIPMLMWTSPGYAKAHPDKVAGLKSHLAVPLSAACTFHTLLDMGGLSCPDFKKERSAASPSFTPSPRMVCDSYGKLIDYDKKFPLRRDAAKAPPQQTPETTQQIAVEVQRP
ncbi:MAG: phosphoethanolamine transferase [Prosthecobacter sp.]|nr:phosphoethanolamine transferase [Prosthecobacter sp.]